MGKKIKTIVCLLLGNALLALGVCAFIVPNGFMLGGSTGIALTIQHILPFRLSVISGMVNGGLFLLGFIFLGTAFAASSLFSTVVYPLMLAVLEELPLTTWFGGDPLICAVFGAVVMGVGIGLVGSIITVRKHLKV